MNKNFERKIVNIFLPICFNICRVHTPQGNVREIKKDSRSGNCQGILCCVREK